MCRVRSLQTGVMVREVRSAAGVEHLEQKYRREFTAADQIAREGDEALQVRRQCAAFLSAVRIITSHFQVGGAQSPEASSFQWGV